MKKANFGVTWVMASSMLVLGSQALLTGVVCAHAQASSLADRQQHPGRGHEHNQEVRL